MGPRYSPVDLVGAVATNRPSSNRLTWLFARLAAMERGEASHRARVALGNSVRSMRDSAHPLIAEFDAGVPGSIITAERAHQLTQALPAEAELLVSAAHRVAAGEFTFLGYDPVRLERPFVYRRDPFTKRRWPLRHGLLVDYRASATGDPKWAWELNRLQHIPLLLAAWRLDGDEMFRASALGDLDAWFEQDRPGHGIAWSNGFEAGLRAISLALAADALRTDGHAFDGATAQSLLVSLSEHVRWIERFPSIGSSANNHRLAELVAIIVVASLVPELQIDAVADVALARLSHECPQQFAPDGGYREQAFSYALFALDLLLLAWATLAARSAEVPGLLVDTIATAAAAISMQVDDDGSDPRYGDADDGRASALDGHARRAASSVAAGIAAASGDPDAKRVASRLDATAFWLFGQEGAARFSGAVAGAAPVSGHLAQTGLILLRSGRTTVMFDVGPLGHGRLAAHGHADSLQVNVCHGGVTLVGDPGTGSYFGSPVIRSAFRGTGFHATVAVDGRDQAEAAGPFLWRRHPTVDVEGFDADAGMCTATHDGYSRLSDPVIHRRTVALVHEALVLVYDELHAASKHAYSIRWPFHARANVRQAESGTLELRLDGLSAWLGVAGSAAVETRICCGSLEPFEGWWSDGLEAVEPAPLASVDSRAARAEFLTAIFVGDVDRMNVERVGPGAFRLRAGGEEYSIEIDAARLLRVERSHMLVGIEQ